MQPPPTTSNSSSDEDTPLALAHPEEVEDFDMVQEFVPIRFLENRIGTLSRTSVPHDLCRLQQHRENMTRLHAQQDWERLNAEQLNASRTVQVSIN